MSFAAIGTIATVASVGVGAASAAGAFAPDAPGAPNYGQLSRDAQQAQLDLLPARYQAQAQYDPQFAALAQRILYQNRFGAPAGTRQESYQDFEERPGDIIQLPYGNRPPDGYTVIYPGNGPGSMATYRGPSYRVPVTRQRTITQEATPGELDMLIKSAPLLKQAERAYDPFAAGLSDTLLRQAQEQLDSPEGLTVQEQRAARNNAQAPWTMRGLGVSPGAAIAETIAMQQARRQRLLQNQQFAGNVVSQRLRTPAIPWTTPYQSQVPSGTDPFIASLIGQNIGQQNAANIAGYNSQMAGIGALAQGAGRLGGLAYQYSQQQQAPMVGAGYDPWSSANALNTIYSNP